MIQIPQLGQELFRGQMPRGGSVREVGHWSSLVQGDLTRSNWDILVAKEWLGSPEQALLGKLGGGMG